MLAQASDGIFYVVKFNNNIQGPNVALNEGLGNELYRACGLPVPDWKPLLVSDAFLDKNPKCWTETLHETVRPPRGICFGTRYLGLDGVRATEMLPRCCYRRVRNRSSFCLAWLVDACAEHADSRQAIFVQDREGLFDAFFVDHGHMFAGPSGDLHKGCIASRFLEPDIYRALSFMEMLQLESTVLDINTDTLWERARSLPDEWKTISGIDHFAAALNRMSSVNVVHRIADVLAESCRYNSPRAYANARIKQRPSHPLLRFGLQSAGL